MKSLAETGRYEVTGAEKEALAEDFFAACAGEDETVEAMYEVFEEYGYPMDTHTGVAMHAANLWREKQGQKGRHPRRGALHRQSLQISAERADCAVRQRREGIASRASSGSIFSRR